MQMTLTKCCGQRRFAGPVHCSLLRFHVFLQTSVRLSLHQVFSMPDGFVFSPHCFILPFHSLQMFTLSSSSSYFLLFRDVEM